MKKHNHDNEMAFIAILFAVVISCVALIFHNYDAPHPEGEWQCTNWTYLPNNTNFRELEKIGFCRLDGPNEVTCKIKKCNLEAYVREPK